MKKFTKISLMIVAVLAGLGIILCGIAALLGVGKEEIWRQAKDGGLYWGNWHVGTYGIYYGEDDRDGVFYSDGEWSENSALQQEIALSDVKNIKLDIGVADIDVTDASEDACISAALLRGEEKYYSCQLEGDTLVVKYDASHYRSNSTPKIALSIPKNASFETITMDIGAADAEFTGEAITCEQLEINVGAGELEAENFVVTKKLEATIGAGSIEVKDGEFSDVKLECGIGELSLSGRVTGDIKGHCGMGELKLKLDGNETDYNYQLSCGLGEININNSDYSNISGSKKIENAGAIGTLDLDCGMGEIEVIIE